MKISYNWLKEYVDVKNSAKMAAEWLTTLGLEVTALEEKGRDTVLEAEITSNRPDWLSVIGVARELSAITGKRLKIPRVPNILPVATREKDIGVDIHDKLLCPRYCARIIDEVKVGPSPKWLREHLDSIGVRSINNVVDITNFCLFELGQPMHAFDYSKLMGRQIIVRRARKNEEIITIDNVKRALENDMLVIADEKRPVAIAGVMGGLETEVTEGTKTVLLESAYFDPISVRRTQRKLGLSTDSSYRFERGVDFDCVYFGSNRAAKLIAENCGGKIGILKDAGTKVTRSRVVKFSVDKANEILSLDLNPVLVKKILISLGLDVAGAQKELRVTIPSFRRDISIEEDLIEEVSRVYGYDKIPTTIPKIVGHPERKAFGRRMEELAREILTCEGLDEVINYSLIDRDSLKKAPVADENNVVVIKNPLSSQQEVMRPSLIYGVLNSARFNINRKAEDIAIFELSKVYSRLAEKSCGEEANLCVLLSGMTSNNWRQKTEADFFEIKGIVETLLDALGVHGREFSSIDGSAAAGIFYRERAARILIKDAEIGAVGQVRRDILERFDIKKDVLLCEIRFGRLLEFADVEKRFAPLPKFLPAKRDISLVVEKGVNINELAGAMRAEGSGLLVSAKLSDEYFGSQIPAGKKGITFSLEYLSLERQLTDQDIEGVHGRIKEALKNKFGANIR